MVYRQAAEVHVEPPVVVRYGLFSIHLGALGMALGFFAFGIGSIYLGIQRERIVCERFEGGNGRCSVRTEIIVTDWERFSFPVQAIREVRWVPYEGNKGVDKGKTELIDEVGRSIRLADRTRSDAHRMHIEIRRFFENSDQRTLDVTASRPIYSILLGLAFMAAFVWAVVFLLRRTTSFRLVVDREARTLSVRRRRFGIPGELSIIDVTDLKEVEVEEGKLDLWYQQKHAEGKPTGRIVLVYDDGRRRWLTDDLHLGLDVHYRTAVRLRELLLLGKDGSGSLEPFEESESSSENGQIKPAQELVGPQAHEIWWRRFPKWSSNMKYSLILVVVVFIPGIVVYVSDSLDTDRGTLEVRCTYRCKMRGFECLPGGMWQDSFKTGSYTVEVWNPAVQGNWEPIRVHVEKGKHTVFECRPRQD